MSKKIQKGIRLCDLTTMKVGGAAEFFVSVGSEEALHEAVRYAKDAGVGVQVLGGGSNMVVADAGVQGLVVHMNNKGVTYKEEGDVVYVTAAAGENFDALVAALVEKEIWGLENLSWIPGSVGAAPIQNIGAYGREVAECIESVAVYDMVEGLFTDLSNKECRFGYRDSFFKSDIGKQYIVTGVTFKLSRVPERRLAYKDIRVFFDGNSEPSISEIRDAVIAIRSKKFPDLNVVGTSGSFFKNPVIEKAQYEKLQKQYPELPGFAVGTEKVKVSLGWILDKVLDVRGVRDGSVGLYENQALVLVNHGGATAAEIQRFAEGIAQKVYDATNITIEWEVTLVV